MAKVIIESGVVENTGKGNFSVSEEYVRNDGSRGKQYFKVWSNEPVEKGQVIAISGDFSAKPSVDFQTGEERKWTDREGKQHTSVEVVLNNPTIRRLSGNDPF